MKQIQTTDGVTWQSINAVNLTEEQRTILADRESQAAKDLVAEIQASRLSALSAEESAVIQAKYDEKKPTLKEGDQYQLIAVNATLSDDNTIVGGIINCRVNGEHQQIRF